MCLTLSGGPPAPPPAPKPPSNTSMDATVDIVDTIIAKTSAYMASFNFDWHKDNEEVPRWINSSALKIDLDSPMLNAAASALAPAVLRIGGSEGDVLCYDVPEFGSTCASMNQTDPDMCLNMTRYKQLVRLHLIACY